MRKGGIIHGYVFELDCGARLGWLHLVLRSFLGLCNSDGEGSRGE